MIHNTKHMIIKFLDIWRSNGTEQKVYKLTWILFSRQWAVHRILWNNVTNSDQCVRKRIRDWCRGWFRAGEEQNEERLLQTSRWKNTRASSSGDESGRDLPILWSTEVQLMARKRLKITRKWLELVKFKCVCLRDSGVVKIMNLELQRSELAIQVGIDTVTEATGVDDATQGKTVGVSGEAWRTQCLCNRQRRGRGQDKKTRRWGESKKEYWADLCPSSFVQIHQSPNVTRGRAQLLHLQ